MKKRNMALIMSATLLLTVLTGCSEKQQASDSSSVAPSTAASAGETEGSSDAADIAWPEKPITIVVPFGAGGDSDFNARILAKYLEPELGCTIVIENQKGSGGTIGSTSVKDADPDGYTILSNHNALMISKVSDIADFGLEAFELAGIYAGNPGDVIAVSSSTGITDMNGLKAACEKKKMSIATQLGSTTQVMSFQVGEYCNVTQVDVGGIADKITALLGGQVDIIIGPYGNIAPYVETGDMNILGVCTEERAALYSDIPTCIEQGYDIHFPTRFFLAFPKGTDQAIVDKFAAAVEKVVTTNEKYAAEIAEGYYETPLWISADEAVAVYDEITEMLNKYSLTSLQN